MQLILLLLNSIVRYYYLATEANLKMKRFSRFDLYYMLDLLPHFKSGGQFREDDE